MNLALDPAVARKLDAYRRRRARLTAFRSVCAGVTALLIGLAAVALIDWYWLLGDSTRWLLSAAAYGGAIAAAAVACVGRVGRAGSRAAIAAAIEDADPEVRERLLSAVELAADDPAAVHDSPAFRALLQGDVARRMAHVRPAKLLPLRLVAGWAVAAALVVGLTAVAAATGGDRVRHLLHRAALPGANLARVSRVRVEILQPSPPSRTLPAGDTVATVVAVSGDGFLDGGVDEVILEAAEPRDGAPRLLPMRRAGGGEWAVNLPLGEEDVTYRILAGDAITERHTLTVRPRPRITAFGKTITFPDYAALPPETVTEPHGDLFALVGSTVELTLEPNQPVREAELHIAPADPNAPARVLPLTAAEGPDGVALWTTTLPMDVPGTYRVHLVGAETGFDNPFAPRSEIRPLADSPPTVAFTKLPEGAAAGLLLPPDDLLDLAASAADDLPLDGIEQLVSINGGEWVSTPLAFESVPAVRPDGGPTHAADLAAEWRWDLLKLKLKTGDEVRTKLSATDRKGQTGQGATLRILIAGEDFDPLRHLAAERKIALVDEFDLFSTALAEQRELAYAALERVRANPDDAAAAAEEYAVLRDLRARRRDAAAALTATLAAALPQQPAGADALELELLGRLVSGIGTAPAADPAAERDRGVAENQVRDAARRDFAEAADAAADAEKWVRRFAAHSFLAAIAADLAAVHRQQDRAVETPDMTWDRLARQEAVVSGRLEAVEEFARRHRDRLPGGAQREVDGLLKGSGEMRTKLELAAARPGDDEPDGEDLRALRDAARAVRDEMAWRHKPNALHGLADELRNSWRDLWRRTGDLSGRLDAAADLAARAGELTAKLAAADDSAEADKLRAELAQVAADPDGALAPTIARLRDARTLQKARPDADTIFAADAGLAARAIDAVAEAAASGETLTVRDPADGNPADGEPEADMPAGDAGEGNAGEGDAGPAPPEGVTPAFALGEIAPALGTLHAGHELAAARRAAETLRERERWGAQSPAGRFDHPRQWDALEGQLEQALERLRRANATGEGQRIEHAINAARWSPTAQRAKPLIVDRRWNEAGPVAADAELAQLAVDLRAVEAELAPTMAEARAVLAKYAPTIPELARDAAEAARQREDAADAAAEATAAAETEPAAAREAVRELAREQAAAERDLDELAEALADDADRQDLTDEAQRNRAKDADAAVAAVRAPAEAADDALADAARAAADENAAPEEQAAPLTEAADRQADTAEALDLVAEHFEKLDDGATPEEIAATREALREAADEAGAAEALEQRFAPSEALADAAEGDPRALLEQLEAELAVNPAMREALSDIAADTAADVQNTLEESVEQERDIQADLDRSDKAFFEKKEVVAENLRTLAKAAERLKERAAETAEKAVDHDRAPEARASIQEAREALEDAAEATKNVSADAPLPELADAADQAGKALEKAADALDKAREQAADRTDAEVHKDDREREDRRRGLEKDRQRLREAQARDAKENQRRAESGQRAAETKLRQAEREARESAERAKKSREQAAREPDSQPKAEQAANEAAIAAEKQAAKEAAEQARDAAKTAAESAKKATDAVGKQPNPKLDAANPGAQLAEQLAGEAAEGAAALRKQAAEVAAAAGFNNELDASESELARSEERQAGVTERVAAAAADLERAARHEERLGQPANAETLEAAARAVSELAEGESTAAEGKLAEAADQAQAADQAGESNAGEPNAGEPNAGEADPDADVAARAAVGEAEAALAGEAQALGQTLDALAGEAEPGQPAAGQPAAGQPAAGQPAAGAPAPGEPAAAGEAPAGGDAPPPGASQPGSPQAGSPQAGSQPPPRQRISPEEQARGQDLARQLDAIDRAMNAPPPAAGESGETQPGEGEPGAPTDAAAELFAAAAAAQAAAVSAARAAQNAPPTPGMPMPGQAANAPPGQPASGAAEGTGVADGAGGIGVDGVRPDAVANADWANLRRKDAEDVSAGRSAAVSEEYRDSVNAYFRVLAERARRGAPHGNDR